MGVVLASETGVAFFINRATFFDDIVIVCDETSAVVLKKWVSVFRQILTANQKCPIAEIKVRMLL